MFGAATQKAGVDPNKPQEQQPTNTLAPVTPTATPPPPKKSYREEKGVPIVTPKFGQDKFIKPLAWHESRNKPDAINKKNPDGSTDVGWTQVNSKNLDFINKSWGTKLTLDDLKDKEINTMAFYLISNDNGIRFKTMFGTDPSKEDILVTHNRGLGSKKGYNKENGRKYLNRYYENEKGWAIEEKRIADEEAKAKADAEAAAKNTKK